MKRVKYKTIHVKRVNWEQLEEKVRGKKVILSIDVAKREFVALLRTADEAMILLIKWQHPDDTDGLLERLTRLNVESLEAVMEPTGTYGDALHWQLTQRRISVYRVSTKHTHDQAESFDGVPSNHDAKAACIIGDLHVRGKSQLWPQVPEAQRQQRALLERLHVHQKHATAQRNRLQAEMARHWPELEYIVEPEGLSVLTLLHTYGSPAEVARHAEAADALLRTTSRGRLNAEKRQKIIDSAIHTQGVPCLPEEQALIQEWAGSLLAIREVIATLEQQMREHLEEQVQPEFTALCSVVTATVLLALLGDLTRYATPQALLKAIGLNLKERSSGQYRGALKITKRGPSLARHYLYWFTLRMIQNDPHVRAWYNRKVERDGRRNGKLRAVIAVMRKLVKGLWHVARGEAFDASRLFSVSLPQT